MTATDSPAPSQRSVTELLRAVDAGDASAKAQLFAVLYAELHARAARLVHRRSKNVTLQATALVNEAYLRVVGRENASYPDRNHFLEYAAAAMRHVLADHARRPRPKSGEEQLLDAIVTAFEESVHDIEKLNVAVEELAQRDPVMAKAVDLRFFADVSEDETARILGLSVRTLQRRWRVTRDWLKFRCRDS